MTVPVAMAVAEPVAASAAGGTAAGAGARAAAGGGGRAAAGGGGKHAAKSAATGSGGKHAAGGQLGRDAKQLAGGKGDLATGFLAGGGGRGKSGGKGSKGGRSRLTGRYDRVLLAEFVICMVLLGLSPLAKGADETSPRDFMKKGSATAALFIVLGLLSAIGPKTSKAAAAFGGLCTLVLLIDQRSAFGMLAKKLAPGGGSTAPEGDPGEDANGGVGRIVDNAGATVGRIVDNAGDIISNAPGYGLGPGLVPEPDRGFIRRLPPRSGQ
jgi:hypothetical protein